MKSKLVLGILLTLLFIGVLAFAFRIKPVKAWTGGTIVIKDDGSVSPPGAPLSSSDFITYNLTEDIISTAPWTGSAIVVNKSNIILDGKGYTLQGPEGTQFGINLTERSGVTIRNMKIEGFVFSIWLNLSDNNLISGINMTNNITVGISLGNSDNNNITGNLITGLNSSIMLFGSHLNRVYGNNITNGGTGVGLGYSVGNFVFENNITNNLYGVQLFPEARYNNFFHNNFIDNTQQVYIHVPDAYRNYWNATYPSGGNYWSDQAHGYWADVFGGPGQDIDAPGGGPLIDGIVDDPYELDELNEDMLPLKYPWTPIKTIVSMGSVAYAVTIVSNTSISSISGTGGRVLRFDSSGQTGEKGCILVIFPKDTEPRPDVKVNGGNPPDPFPTVNDNGTHWFIYMEIMFSSTATIDIQFWPTVGGTYIPSNKLSLLAPYIALASTLIAATAATAIYVKHVKHRKKKQ